jgi:hypothetical protein
MRRLPARAHDNGLFLVYSNGVGVDDNEIRTGELSLRKPMILDPYGRILAETWEANDDMVVADLDASLLEVSTGERWIKTRRPELYEPLTVPTGLEQDTRTVRFDKKGRLVRARYRLGEPYSVDKTALLTQEAQHASSIRSRDR